MTETWPYATDGARQDDPVNAYRLPIITTAYPSWAYVTAVVVSELWGGVRPTEHELTAVAAFHEYYMTRWYGPAGTGYRHTMEQRPLDIDGGANGRILAKQPNGSWCYRHRSWTLGSTFWPCFEPDSDQHLSLLDLLDQHEDRKGKAGRDRWKTFKAGRPEVFTAITKGQ